MEILLGMAILGLVAEAVLITRMFQKQIADLNDRLATKSIEEYKYYKEVYPKEVEAEEKKQKLQVEDVAPDDLVAYRAGINLITCG